MKTSPSRMAKAFASLLLFRIVVQLAHAFGAIDMPHIWRQSDTLSVAMRYWNRWTVEPVLQHPLLPAVMNSGDAYGFAPMEFPLLNFLFAPAFAFGPHCGKIVAMIVLVVVVSAVVWLVAHLWGDKEISGEPALCATLLLPLISYGLTFSGKFMPDFISMLLVFGALGASWKKERPLASFVLATTGVLMKPVSIVVLVLALTHPEKWKKWTRQAIWGIPMLFVSGLYYTKGLDYLSSLRPADAYVVFGVHVRNPAVSLVTFLSRPDDLLKLFYEMLCDGGLPLLAGAAAFRSWKSRTNAFSPLWLCLLIQLVCIAMLDGDHLYVHTYYLMSLVPTLALLVVDFWRKHPQPVLRGILICLLAASIVQNTQMVLRSLFHAPEARGRWIPPQQCEQLKARHPEFPWNQGAVFRSNLEKFPLLALCFGERQDSLVSPYGFFWKETPLPPACQEVDATSLLVLAKCDPHVPSPAAPIRNIQD